jgi:hypothetical protein
VKKRGPKPRPNPKDPKATTRKQRQRERERPGLEAQRRWERQELQLINQLLGGESVSLVHRGSLYLSQLRKARATHKRLTRKSVTKKT